MKLYMSKEDMARDLFREVKKMQLENFRKRMPKDKQGSEFEINGIKYVAAIRRLTPEECDKLQGVPAWYDWHDISETQHYRMIGNGWQCDTIKHCWSFLPEFGRPIRVWSLFDGMSCASITLNELGIPVETFVSSEVDKHAIAAEKQNFPNMIQVGSVTDINVQELVEKYGVPDFLCGGSPCFAEHTKVLTIGGYKNIEDVQVGDMVLTHKNRYRRVLAVGHKEAMTYDLSAQGYVKVRCTANHPFYARKKNFVPCILPCGKKSKHLELEEISWVEAQHLKDSYYIASNIEMQPEENPLGITEEEAWAIGRYIADGHTRKDVRFGTKSNGIKDHNGSRAWQLILSIGNAKLEQFTSHFSTLHYSCYPHSEDVHRVVFSNKRLVEIVEDQCGCGAYNKHFGEKLIRLPKHLLKIILDAFLEGDGFLDKKDVWHITTISKMLPITIQRVISKLYGKHICVTRHVPPATRLLCGRSVHQHVQYVIRFADHDLANEKAKRIEDKIWTGVRLFTPAGRQTVYNMEVEEDNSYTANNMIVHNCQSFSFSGKMKGMSTAQGEEIYTLDHYIKLKKEGFEFEGQSYLFWEYMRILKELQKINPNIYFFLENVVMLEKWERVLSHAIGVRGVHINSALVSAQQRKRIYWSNIRVKDLGYTSLFEEFNDSPFEWPNKITDIPQPEEKGIVIKDILQDAAGDKYYLKDETVSKLMEKTDKKKLHDYLVEPQVTIEEALAYMNENKEYSDLSDEEKMELATLGYHLEKKRLDEAYNGKTMFNS